MELGEPIVWEHVKTEQSNEASPKWTHCVFGECGQGKSTDLTIIAKIYLEKFCDDEN